MVTGANRGIGREVARQLAQRGYDVLLTARDSKQATAVAGQIAGETGACAIERTLQTNFYGAYRLTIALLDLLRRSAHPRIVNVSSGMGGVAEMGGWSPGYRVSKAALNAVTGILSPS